MSITAAQFRGNFPEFMNQAVYPTSEVDFYLNLGTLLLNIERWGNLFDFGQQLFVAHNLALEFTAKKNAATGGNPGEVAGPKTAASVDKVSYSRNPGLVMNPANGHWNLTTYGLRYINLVKLVGAGPIYIGAPGPNECAPGGAWFGPILGPMGN